MSLLLIATLPVFLLLIYIYRKDNVNPEPLGKLIVTFVAGCFIVIPTALQELILQYLVPDVPIIGPLFNGFVVAGFTEEMWKLIALLLLVWGSRHFNEYFDGIVYSVYVSMGFALVENIMYVFEQWSVIDSLITGVMRALLAIPAHFLFAVAMGYYLSLAKFDINHCYRNLFLALLCPMLLHGTYDSLLMISGSLEGDGATIMNFVLFVAFIIFDIRMWKWGLKRIQHLQELSQQQDFDRHNPFYNFHW